MNKTGSGNKGLDWVIFAGMVAAFPKTADLLSYWSPEWLNEIFGMDVSLFYGAFCAAMVEGTILFLHFDRRAHRVASAQTVKWILIGISFLCQVFDGQVTQGTVDQMSATMKVILTYGIPALPLLIAVMVASIGSLPEDDTPKPSKPRVGLKTRWKNLLEGEENTVRSPVVRQLEENIESPELVKNPNGEHEEDFTSRQNQK